MITRGKNPMTKQEARQQSHLVPQSYLSFCYASNQTTNAFKILNPNQHISQDYKSGPVAICDLSPGSELHANMNDSGLHKIKVNDWTIINKITQPHIFAIPIVYPRQDMTFNLMNPGIGTDVECYNGFRVFSSYGEINNKTVLVTDTSRDVMDTYVISKHVPYNLTYEFTTPDGIHRNCELITTFFPLVMKILI